MFRTGDRRRLDHLALVKIVAQAKTGDAPVCEMAMKVERLEGETFELPHQFGLFRRRDQLRLVAKSLRQVVTCVKVGRTKQVALPGEFRLPGFERWHQP
ncbi:hypothetical protein SAMN05428953_101398 [Mesorhizobium muleiense]|uniref:Uncharacterized protein n=1 Tax=Mesorhizobium muleiense TaxID=1004279 RepID=A0A1G8IJF8_9HYPH|nr:hypothetical protein SAMN05428953_101398 [Mesorhizobium muleiense]